MSLLIATTTLYSHGLEVNDVRRNLAFEAARNAQKLDIPMLVLDGSEGEEISASFRSYGAHVFRQQTKGMGSSRREAFFHAIELCKSRDIKVIVWTEPEKAGYIQYAEETALPIIRGAADMVFACRTEASRVSYPQFQVKSEVRMNTALANALRMDEGNLYLGPIAFSVEAAMKYVLCQHPSDYGIEDKYIQINALIIGKRCGARVVSSRPFDVIYPEAQRIEESGVLSEKMINKRKEQLRGISHACEVLDSL